MNIQLKPCPFCGGIADIWQGCDYHYVMCRRCKSKTADFEKDDEAVDAWNKRAERISTVTRARDSAYKHNCKCDGCGFAFNSRFVTHCPGCGAKIERS
ncbi:MAG: Lar family restriction alleviation protein [Oscillospiraceae bacterium]|nr:Lar family restriction alleviation protein [Oscillospiraceae bacterium]